MGDGTENTTPPPDITDAPLPPQTYEYIIEVLQAWYDKEKFGYFGPDVPPASMQHQWNLIVIAHDQGTLTTDMLLSIIDTIETPEAKQQFIDKLLKYDDLKLGEDNSITDGTTPQGGNQTYSGEVQVFLNRLARESTNVSGLTDFFTGTNYGDDVIIALEKGLLSNAIAKGDIASISALADSTPMFYFDGIEAELANTPWAAEIFTRAYIREGNFTSISKMLEANPALISTIGDETIADDSKFLHVIIDQTLIPKRNTTYPEMLANANKVEANLQAALDCNPSAMVTLLNLQQMGVLSDPKAVEELVVDAQGNLPDNRMPSCPVLVK
ncbi:MAG: hypothetical protein IT567_03225 [Alphaproteobacteria bacterium]|nr:hypothetical protein [Alphaproteobacteria bacterium]